jgi:spermidine/putrescine transport system permease protein
MVILNTSQNVDAAHAFINFILDPANHAWVAENILYKVPNKAAMDVQAVKDLNASYPNMGMTPADLLKQEVIVDLGADSVKYTDLATEVTSRSSSDDLPSAVQSMTVTTGSGRGAARRRALIGRAAFAGPGLAYVTAFMTVPLLLIARLQRAHPWSLRRGELGVHPGELRQGGQSHLPVDPRRLAGDRRHHHRPGPAAGYRPPTALSRLPSQWRTVALVLVVLPFWSNFLIRTYAWIVLLNSQGPVNSALVSLGVIGAPLDLLYNRGAVVTGLLYAYLPLVVLPVYAAIERVDPQLQEAARNLGATKARTFWDITLPLTLPGAMIGAIFVFVPSMGNFVVPELLGGGKTVMVGNLIRDQFLEARNWPFGAVLALAVVAFLVLLFAGQALVSRRINARGSHA